MSDQESRVNLLFRSIESEFAAFDQLEDDRKAESKLKTITGMIRDCKTVIKEYEREARVDGLPASEILSTKQKYVSQVNGYVGRKKKADQSLKTRMAAAAASANAAANSASAAAYASTSTDGYGVNSGGPPQQKQIHDMTNQEIVGQGRTKMDATDAELAIARRVAAQTEETAVQTAAQLKKQTDQMNTVAEDLNEIEFTMKRANRVIRDVARGMATDKCIMCLIFLVALAIVGAIVLKLLGVGGDIVKLPGPDDGDSSASEAAAGRKLLLESINRTFQSRLHR